MARGSRRIAFPVYTPPCPTHLLFLTIYLSISRSVFLSKYSPWDKSVSIKYRIFSSTSFPNHTPQISPLSSLNSLLLSMEKVSNSSSSNKRLRSQLEKFAEAKRLRVGVLDILAYDDDQTDSGDDGSAVEDLACVMQSLREEISISIPATMATEETVELPDLGYLLEASDDELGLPPTGIVPSPAGSETEAGAFINDEVRSGFFDDLDFDILLEAGAGDGGADMFNDSLFEYDVFSGGADFFDTTWQSESLQTV